jgi:very-short-patch-repair endonuclease
MTARRNSPRIDQLSGDAHGALLRRLARGSNPPPTFAKPPAPPNPPKQAEMGGMETSDAATVLMTEQRRREQKREKSRSKEDLFDHQLRSYKLPPFERQLMFAKEIGRRWLFDFANREFRVAVEVEGLVVMKVGDEWVVKGRHASITGFKEDAIKYASAAILGWTVLRFEQSQVKDGTAIELTQRLLAARGWKR